MEIGISTACFCSSETEEALGQIEATGAKLCEIYLRTFYEYRPEFAKKFAPLLAGAKAWSVHAAPYNFEPQLFFRERRIRGDGFYWLEQVMRSANLLGAKNYTFHGTVRKGRESCDNFGAIAERLNEIAEFCLGCGVTPCLENVHGGLYNRPSVFKELKSRCNNLAGVFDIKQARKSDYPYSMYLRDMEGAISHVHISDVDENGKTCLPGRGLYDFKEVLLRLKDVGFDGPLIIETGNWHDVSELKTSVEYLNEIIYTI